MKYSIAPHDTNPESPGYTPPDYEAMRPTWELLHDLHGGTEAMRKNASKWLRRGQNETDQDYQIRISRSTLYNAYLDTLNKLQDKPFSREVLVRRDDSGDGALSTSLRDLLDDTDGIGGSLSKLLGDAWLAASTHGVSFILTDYPPISPEATLADERSSGARPYAVVIPRPNILDSVVPGAPITRVRLFERVKTVLPPHGYGVVDQIRIIEVGPDGKGPGTWTTHRRQTNDSSKWAQHDTGSYLLPFIPLRVMTFNADQPPLRDLADLNLVHFQSLSEHRALMRVARTSMLTATGLTAEERDRTFTISNDYMLKSTNKDAKFYFTEHTGAAAGASEADLRALEQRMEVMGLQPLVARTSNDTAAGKRINENRSDSLVHRWVRVAEKAAKHVVQDLAEFARQPVRVVVDIFDDFQAIRSNAEDNELLVTMGEKLLITPRTFLEEMQRRDVLADTLDIDAELDGLKAERDKLAESAAKVAEVTAARSASVSEMA